MYLFELVLKIISNMNFYEFNKQYAITNNDLNLLYDLFIDNKSKLSIVNKLDLITYNIIVSKIEPYYISGLSKIDNKYLNPYNKRPNDKYYNHLNYNLIELRLNNKVYEVGFNSFLNFIKPFIHIDNYTDYYKRLDDLSTLKLIDDLDKSFNNQKVFKFNLSSIDIEKLNKKYLLFKNDLIIGEYRLNFIKYDEFIKNIRFKSSYQEYKLLQNEFYNNSYSKNDFLLNSLIIVVQKLSYDDKFNFILCNSIVKNDLLKLLKINKVNWYKSKNDKLLKKVKKSRYEFLSYDDKKDELLKRLKKSKKDLNLLDKRLNSLRNTITLKEKHNKKDDELKRLKNKFNNLNKQLDDLQNDLIDLNNQLIELDKKDDEFKNNLLDNSSNLTFKLKNYLD